MSTRLKDYSILYSIMADNNEALVFKLHDEAQRTVEELASLWGCDVLEVARRCISMGNFIAGKLKEGGTFFYVDPNESVEAVHFDFGDVQFPPDLL